MYCGGIQTTDRIYFESRLERRRALSRQRAILTPHLEHIKYDA